MPLSVTALKAELKALGLDAKTPGLKGDARRDALRDRLRKARATRAAAREGDPKSSKKLKQATSRVTSATISALTAALKERRLRPPTDFLRWNRLSTPLPSSSSSLPSTFPLLWPASAH